MYIATDDGYLTLPELADALRPLLQPAPAPADTAELIADATWYEQHVKQQDARLLAADKRREIAERQLAEVQQANAQLTAKIAELEQRWMNALAAGVTYYGNHTQSDKTAQALHEATQRAEAAEAQLAEAQKTAQEWKFRWEIERSNSDFWTQRAATCERQLADARQGRDELAAQLADANAVCTRLAYTIANMDTTTTQAQD